MKNKRATKVARQKLKMAEKFLKTGNSIEFFEEISRALWGYLSDKFSIPLSELSMETVHNRLSNKQLNEDTTNEFIEVLNNCEYARFAPGDSSEKMNEIYEQAIQIISKIERELK